MFDFIKALSLIADGRASSRGRASSQRFSGTRQEDGSFDKTNGGKRNKNAKVVFRSPETSTGSLRNEVYFLLNHS